MALMMGLGASGCGMTDDTVARPANVPATVATPAEEAELDTGPIVARIRELHAERLAGLYYERDRSRIVVRLTGAEPVATETHAVEGGTLQVVFEPGASHSSAELNRILASSAAKIEAALPTAHGRYVDERTGAIVIAIAPGGVGGRAKEAELARALGAPVRIEVEAPAVLQRQPARP